MVIRGLAGVSGGFVVAVVAVSVLVLSVLLSSLLQEEKNSEPATIVMADKNLNRIIK
jgi:hypothetical protein